MIWLLSINYIITVKFQKKSCVTVNDKDVVTVIMFNY